MKIIDFEARVFREDQFTGMVIYGLGFFKSIYAERYPVFNSIGNSGEFVQASEFYPGSGEEPVDFSYLSLILCR
jgi:hypothetical protein